MAIPADKSTCKVSVNGGAPKTVTLNLQGATVTDYATLRPFLEAAIRAADPNDPNLAGATVQLLGSAPGPFWFRVLSGRGGNDFVPAPYADVYGYQYSPRQPGIQLSC